MNDRPLRQVEADDVDIDSCGIEVIRHEADIGPFVLTLYGEPIARIEKVENQEEGDGVE
jgi:hypothetical protein